MAAPALSPVHRCPCKGCELYPNSTTAQEHRLINQLIATVDERSRRLYAAFLVLQHGRGGMAKVARITGLSRNTLRRGRQELVTPEQTSPDRIRRLGGGRKRLEKKRQHPPASTGKIVAGCHGRRPDVGVEVDA